MGIQFTDCCIEDLLSFIQNTTRLKGTRRRTRYYDFWQGLYLLDYALFVVWLQAFAIGIKDSCCIGGPQCLVNTVLGKQHFVLCAKYST